MTGSGRGIGKETAMLLCKKGLNVVICSNTQTEIDSTVEEIKQLTNGVNDRVIGIRCDVSNSFEVEHLVKSTIDRFKSTIDTTEYEWDKTRYYLIKGNTQELGTEKKE